jgi:zinc/manganese transport system substrate-binding protein
VTSSAHAVLQTAHFLAFIIFANASESNRIPTVVTSNGILQDMVRQVGGDRVQVACLLPPGIDLHAFDPTPETIAQLTRADLLIINGYGLESSLDKVLDNTSYQGPIAVAASRSQLITISIGVDGEHDHGPIDPHAWHDLGNAVTYVEVIRDALTECNPTDASTYVRLADLYIREIQVLDTWARRHLFALPRGSRTMLVSHQGLAYLGRAYGLEIRTLVGLSPYQDPDARQIATIIEDLQSGDIKGLFQEEGSNSRIIEQISRESGVPIGGQLFTGTPGSAGTLSSSLTGMFRLNVMRILRVLEDDSMGAATIP